MSADGYPLIGRLPDVDNAWIATGNGPWGMSCGPATARIAVDAMLGEPPSPLRSTRPETCWNVERLRPRADASGVVSAGGIRSADSTSRCCRLAAVGEITYLDAIRTALADALRDDERVFLLGEDIGHFGGAFGVTAGLLRRVRRRHA